MRSIFQILKGGVMYIIFIQRHKRVTLKNARRDGNTIHIVTCLLQ